MDMGLVDYGTSDTQQGGFEHSDDTFVFMEDPASPASSSLSSTFIYSSILDSPCSSPCSSPITQRYVPSMNDSSESNFQTPLSRSQTPQRSPQTPQSRSLTPQSRSQTPQRSPPTPQRSPQTHQSRPQTPQRSLQTPQRSPQTPQGSPQTPQDRYQTPQSRYQTPQSSPQTPQSRYQTPQSNYKGSYDAQLYAEHSALDEHANTAHLAARRRALQEESEWVNPWAPVCHQLDKIFTLSDPSTSPDHSSNQDEVRQGQPKVISRSASPLSRDDLQMKESKTSVSPQYVTPPSSNRSNRKHVLSSHHFVPQPRRPAQGCLLSEERSHGDEDRREALSSARLRPIRQRMRNAMASISEDGHVCLELIKNKDGQDFVVEVLTVSPDGLMVEVQRHGKTLLLEDRPPTPPPADKIKNYLLEELPEKYWKRYQFAARFVNLIKAKTPKVVMYTRHVKCMLMENSPNNDFEVNFYQGGRLHQTALRTELHLADGTELTLEENGRKQKMSPGTNRMWHYAQECHRRCKELEALMESLDRKPKSDTYFPVIVGQRRNLSAGTCSADSVTTPAKEHQWLQGQRDLQSPSSSPGSTPDKTLCPSPDSSRNQTADLMFDCTLVNDVTPRHIRASRRRSRSVDPSVLRALAAGDGAALQRRRHISGNTSPRSDVTWEMGRQAAQTLTVTSPVPSPDVMSRVRVPGIGFGTLLSNGEVVVQFTDGSVLSLQSSPMMVVRYTDVAGRSSVYNETDTLSDHVRHKLQLIPQVMSTLEAAQASQPQRMMTP